MEFFDFKLQADLSTESWVTPFINDTYMDIINQDPVKPIYYNQGYRSKLDQPLEEKSPKAAFGLKKRLWFEKVKLWNRDVTEDNLIEDTTEYFFSDCKFIDGKRVLMAIYDNDSKIKIFKQININDPEICSNTTLEWVGIWHFVDVTRYEADWESYDFFPTSSCLATKLMIAAWWKWISKDSWDEWIMRIKRIGNDFVTYFYDVNKNIDSTSWDFLYIVKWDYSWQVNPVAIAETSVDNHQGITMALPFAGNYLLDEDKEHQDSNNHSRKVYPRYWDIVHFACSDGIIHLNNLWDKPSETEFTICWAAYQSTANNTKPSKTNISSILVYEPMDMVLYFDYSDGEIQYGLSGYQKFYFKSTNSFIPWRNYTDLVSFWDYIIVIWPSSTAVLYPYSASPGNISSYWSILSKSKWYIDRQWFDVDDSNLFIVTNTKKLFGLSLDVTSSLEGRFVAKPIRAYQSGPIANELSKFNLEDWDRVSLSVEDREIKIFFISSNGTKIKVRNMEHNFWRTYMITNASISFFKNNTRFGKGIFDRIGNKDNGEYFKTITAFQFGDRTMKTTKMIHFLTSTFWRDSHMTDGKTLLKINVDYGGRYYTKTFKDFWRTWWISDMMNLKKTGNVDNAYKTYPVWIELESGMWHGKYHSEKWYLKKELQDFADYDPVGSSKSEFENIYKLWQFADFEMPLNFPTNIITFEFITKWDNEIEFYGSMLWYTILSPLVSRLDNVLTTNQIFSWKL